MSSAENPPVAKEISGEDESAPIIAAIPTGVSINADPIAQHQNTGVCRGCGQEFVR